MRPLFRSWRLIEPGYHIPHIICMQLTVFVLCLVRDIVEKVECPHDCSNRPTSCGCQVATSTNSSSYIISIIIIIIIIIITFIKSRYLFNQSSVSNECCSMGKYTAWFVGRIIVLTCRSAGIICNQTAAGLDAITRYCCIFQTLHLFNICQWRTYVLKASSFT